MEERMNENIFMKNKHLTFDSRIEIQECLNKGITFKAIGKRLCKDQTTISKEVKKHIHMKDEGAKSFIATGRETPRAICTMLLRAPFVCNPCRKRHVNCGFKKQYYHAKEAHKEYKSLLSEARQGIPLNKAAFYEIDRVISECVKKGQRIYHIMNTHNLGVSKSTIYRHIKLGYMSIGPLDLPRMVKFKPRNPGYSAYVSKAAKIGRTHDDFLEYITGNGISVWVEMGTVIGKLSGKVILTLDFTFCNFMVGLLLDNKTAAEAAEKITCLKASLAAEGIRFGDIFPLMLTDNGGEFANVAAFENDAHGERETMLFFCDPMQSSQKPYVEKNHTLFRDIVHKGSSFDSFTPKTVNLIFSHVNSTKRKLLGGKTPYEVFTFTFGEQIAKILGIECVPPEQVIQSPKLLK
jgi:IS30 family transposase